MRASLHAQGRTCVLGQGRITGHAQRPLRPMAAARACSAEQPCCSQSISSDAPQAQLVKRVGCSLLSAAVLAASSSVPLLLAQPAAAQPATSGQVAIGAVAAAQQLVRAPSPVAEVADLAAAFAGDEDAFEAFDHEADLSEEVEQPRELIDFMKLFEKGTPSDEAVLRAARYRVGFQRGYDGRVQLRSGDGDWFAVKNDGIVPGFLLLRDDDGYCYYLPPDQAGTIAQVDLSDDMVVAQLFANGMWQELIEPLEAVAEESGMPQHLQISEEDFRGSLSLLDGAVPGEETALAPLGDDGEDEEGGNGQWQ